MFVPRSRSTCCSCSFAVGSTAAARRPTPSTPGCQDVPDATGPGRRDGPCASFEEPGARGCGDLAVALSPGRGPDGSVLQGRPRRSTLPRYSRDPEVARRLWTDGFAYRPRPALSFDVAAEAYDSYMGRYSTQLSSQLADVARVASRAAGARRRLRPRCPHQRAGRAGRTRRRRRGRSLRVVRRGHPGASPGRRRPTGGRRAAAVPDDAFDAALAQLVVHFMEDPVAGLAEMGRVTRPAATSPRASGITAASQGPLRIFWDAARKLDPESTMSPPPRHPQGPPGRAVRRRRVARDRIDRAVRHVEHPTFDAWWEPFTRGVGPAGAYLASLDADRRPTLRDRLSAASARQRHSWSPPWRGRRAVERSVRPAARRSATRIDCGRLQPQRPHRTTVALRAGHRRRRSRSTGPRCSIG